MSLGLGNTYSSIHAQFSTPQGPEYNVTGICGVETPNYYKLGKHDGIDMTIQGPRVTRKLGSILLWNGSIQMYKKEKGRIWVTGREQGN